MALTEAQRRLFAAAEAAQVNRNTAVQLLDSERTQQLVIGAFVRVLLELPSEVEDYVVARVRSLDEGEPYSGFSTNTEQSTRLYLHLDLPRVLDDINGSLYQLNSVSNSKMRESEFALWLSMMTDDANSGVPPSAGPPGWERIPSEAQLYAVAERLRPHEAGRARANTSAASNNNNNNNNAHVVPQQQRVVAQRMEGRAGAGVNAAARPPVAPGGGAGAPPLSGGGGGGGSPQANTIQGLVGGAGRPGTASPAGGGGGGGEGQQYRLARPDTRGQRYFMQHLFPDGRPPSSSPQQNGGNTSTASDDFLLDVPSRQDGGAGGAYGAGARHRHSLPGPDTTNGGHASAAAAAAAARSASLESPSLAPPGGNSGPAVFAGATNNGYGRQQDTPTRHGLQSNVARPAVPESEEEQIERRLRTELMNQASARNMVVPKDTAGLKVSRLRTLERDLQEYLLHVREEIATHQSQTCVVCMDGVPTVILLPCCHRSLCRLCAPNCDVCPVCRSTITEMFEPEEI